MRAITDSVPNVPAGKGPWSALRLVAVGIAFIVPVATGTALADTTSYTPPFSDAGASTYCDPGAQCGGTATADRTSGEMVIDIESSGLPTLNHWCTNSMCPSISYPGEQAYTWITSTEPAPLANAVLVRVTVETGQVVADGVLGGEGLRLWAQANQEGCTSCIGGAYENIFSANLTGGSVPPASRTVEFTYQNWDGALPATPITVTVTLTGTTNGLKSHLRASATVRSITATPSA